MNRNRRTFLELSAELTGYSATDLEGTGLVDPLFALFEQQVNAATLELFYGTARRILAQRSQRARAHAMRVDLLASPTLWPMATMLVQAWYTGAWTNLPPSWYAFTGQQPPAGITPGATNVVSALAYEQQLSYRGAGAHPPGARPTGHGGWSIPPVFGDAVPPSTEDVR
jgi:hypothetical protein